MIEIEVTDAMVRAAIGRMQWHMDQECWSEFKFEWVRDVIANALKAVDQYD